MKSDRLASIQMLRGVGAVLVVLVHAINVTDVLAPRWGPAIIGHVLALNEFGSCGVDLFFVISGFVMCFALERAQGIDDAITFLRQRWLRVVPPFWIACAIYLVVRLISPEPDGATSLLTAITLLPLTFGSHYSPPPLLVGWTLGFELTFYLLVAVMMMAVGRPARPRALVATLFVVASVGIILPSDNMLFNPLLGEFALGVLVHRAWRRGWAARDPRLLIVVGLTLLGVTLVRGWPFDTPLGPAVAGYEMGWRVLFWGMPWSLVLLGMLYLPVGSGRWADRWTAIGDASYCLYLCHMPICTIVLALVWPSRPWLPPSLLVPLILLISLVLSLWLHRHLERPYLAYLKFRKAAASSDVGAVEAV